MALPRGVARAHGAVEGQEGDLRRADMAGWVDRAARPMAARGALERQARCPADPRASRGSGPRTCSGGAGASCPCSRWHSSRTTPAASPTSTSPGSSGAGRYRIGREPGPPDRPLGRGAPGLLGQPRPPPPSRRPRWPPGRSSKRRASTLRGGSPISRPTRLRTPCGARARPASPRSCSRSG